MLKIISNFYICFVRILLLRLISQACPLVILSDGEENTVVNTDAKTTESNTIGEVTDTKNQ